MPRTKSIRWVRVVPLLLALVASGAAVASSQGSPDAVAGTSGGWVKDAANPVLGGKLGTCFDICVLRAGGRYRMYFSWRPKKSIALVSSADGVHWDKPRIVFGPDAATGWEDDVNRPVVIRHGGLYRLWYTGQAGGHSFIGYARSHDGIHWRRRAKPVFVPRLSWERTSVMCPDVIWDAGNHQYKMWYSAGGQYEPNAIGLATSPDGITWTRHGTAPVFAPSARQAWEQDRVTGCQVIHRGGWYLMFYIGFENIHRAAIGVARSRDGVGGWQRLPANPIIFPEKDSWDADACYKPFAIFDGRQWLLWYNGRRGGREQIGLARHRGEDLGFHP